MMTLMPTDEEKANLGIIASKYRLPFSPLVDIWRAVKMHQSPEMTITTFAYETRRFLATKVRHHPPNVLLMLLFERWSVAFMPMACTGT